MPQIRQVVSEALQSTVRRLLPSQQGFTEDLMATNVITPIIDLTPTAEGSQLPDYLQRALSFDDVTAFDVTNTTSTLINSTGFWQIELNAQNLRDNNCFLTLSNGLSNKVIWKFAITSAVTATSAGLGAYWKGVILLTAGDSVTATASNATRIAGNYRQIADLQGNLVNPSGYVAE